ncbi:sigma D regulator [Gilvimarinus agarilyticus]|uniref:sigma D regulator n=1 Tax=unclassified Gilvimarinus TaxID=2642066 RepID=UPI001C08B5BA|nr:MULTISPECIES: sigma D regulator [unclassified Gilvimarinus]MBU2886329.1 sigma D regulator [Gilvimarinus agarilyticus]MDO6571015.1 sigma D regulator [Gilvimarinus sp. 2_MG-2023]MDO6747975.1 sigma D regulator [Gilvimarinus sp. 1_MG-2023]
MLENCQDAKQRWGGVSQIIDRWLAERQQMLVKYCAVSDTQKNDDDSRGPKLRAMCEIMVDYVSAGHFEVYDQLLKEGQDFGDDQALKQGAELFKKVDATTEEVLDFNDKYQETDDLTALDADLSRLGEVLESRFTSEDQMIAVLHDAHKDMV